MKAFLAINICRYRSPDRVTSPDCELKLGPKRDTKISFAWMKKLRHLKQLCLRIRIVRSFCCLAGAPQFLPWPTGSCRGPLRRSRSSGAGKEHWGLPGGRGTPRRPPEPCCTWLRRKVPCTWKYTKAFSFYALSLSQLWFVSNSKRLIDRGIGIAQRKRLRYPVPVLTFPRFFRRNLNSLMT